MLLKGISQKPVTGKLICFIYKLKMKFLKDYIKFTACTNTFIN